jgi:predicted GNAT superfamily acetyltransferase
MAVSIRPALTIEDCRVIERLQAEIWGFKELQIVPDHLLLTLAKEGNVVLLAEDESRRPVGFAFGFLSYAENRRLKLASHQVGVLPAYQNQGIGYALKLAQRQAVLALGLDLITWTFDPLQVRNAYLNLNKLGVVCSTYLPDLYGNMADQLNQGLPTDRFRADWWVATGHVGQRLAGKAPPAGGGPVVNTATHLPAGLRAPAGRFDVPDSSCCRVEIPGDLLALKLGAPELARQWRLHTRQVFQALFCAGYIAVALQRQPDRNYYLLQKGWQPEGTVWGP